MCHVTAELVGSITDGTTKAERKTSSPNLLREYIILPSSPQSFSRSVKWQQSAVSRFQPLSGYSRSAFQRISSVSPECLLPRHQRLRCHTASFDNLIIGLVFPMFQKAVHFSWCPIRDAYPFFRNYLVLSIYSGSCTNAEITSHICLQ